MEGIEKIKASIASVKALVDTVGDILADGKVSLSDIKELPELISEINTLVGALKGIDEEVKDLDSKEIKVVLAEGFDLLVYVYNKIVELKV